MKAGIGNTIINLRKDSGGGSGETKFVIEVTIDDTDASGNRDFQFYSYGTIAETNYNIDWGDGNSDTGVTASNITHTYSANGVYDIKIDGRFGIRFNSTLLTNRYKITKLKNWGTNEASIQALYQAFYNCRNMTYEATDYPDLSNLNTGTFFRSFQNIFHDCRSITDLDLSNWQNTNLVNNLTQAFFNCRASTSINLTGWDTSNVTNLANTFRNIGSDAVSGCSLIAPNLNLTSLNSVSNQGLTSCFQDSNPNSSSNIDNWVLPTYAISWSFVFYYRKITNTFFTNFDFLATWTNKIPTTLRAAWRCNSVLDDVTTNINLTGFDTSSCGSFREAFMSNAGLERIEGLNSLSSASILGVQSSVFSGCRSLGNLDEAATSFWQGFSNGTNFNTFFLNVGRDVVGGVNPPNLTGSTFASGVSFQSMFQQASFNSTVDVSDFDMSSITGGGATSGGIYAMFYLNDGITNVDASNWALNSAGFKTLRQSFRDSEITTVNFGTGISTNDFSAVITMQDAVRGSQITSLDFPTNADFSSITVMTNFALSSEKPMTVAQYDNFLLRFDATNSNSGITLNMGTCQYTGGGAVATARANIIARGNTITDGGAV